MMRLRSEQDCDLLFDTEIKRANKEVRFASNNVKRKLHSHTWNLFTVTWNQSEWNNIKDMGVTKDKVLHNIFVICKIRYIQVIVRQSGY